MTVYIAGPMTGYPDLNRGAFAAAAARLTAAGRRVCNPHGIAPHDHEGDCPTSYAVNPDGHGAACYLRTCLAALVACEEIHLLPGWEHSVGARLELQVATAIGLSVSFAWGPDGNDSHRR